jgi:multidrug resistance protein, MATE family
MLCEVSAFSMAGLIMGRFGQSAMAAHQIAITLAGTAFMIPLGLSMALTVQIGRADGAGEQSRLRPIILSGWILAAGYSLVAAGVFLIFGKFLASRFIHVPEVISLASSLLVVVGVFQLVDSIQVASSAMLRGLQDARVPAVMGFTAYWLVGLPVAAGLAFVLKMAALGVWWGLAVGLFIACITLAPRLWSRTRGAISPR